MRAAAELDGVLLPLGIGGVFEQFAYRCADGDDADHRRVFFAEDGPQTEYFERLFLRGNFRVHRQLFRDALVDEILHLGEFIVGHRLRMHEVEAKFVRIDQ